MRTQARDCHGTELDTCDPELVVVVEDSLGNTVRGKYADRGYGLYAVGALNIMLLCLLKVLVSISQISGRRIHFFQTCVDVELGARQTGRGIATTLRLR